METDKCRLCGGNIRFNEDHTRGVCERCGAAIGEPESSRAENLLKRGTMALEDGQWQNAWGFFEQVLNRDAECAGAYLGEKLAQAMCRTPEEFTEQRIHLPEQKRQTLVMPEENAEEAEKQKQKLLSYGVFSREQVEEACRCDRSFSSCAAAFEEALRTEEHFWRQDPLLSKVLRFGPGGSSGVLENIKNGLKSRLAEEQKRDAEAAEQIRRNARSHWGEAVENLREGSYQELLRRSKSRDRKVLLKTSAALERMKDCRDTEEAARACRERAEMLQKKARKRKKLLWIFIPVAAVLIALALLIKPVFIPLGHCLSGERALAAGDFERAREEFRLAGSFGNAREKILEAWYAEGEAAIAAGKPNEADNAFRRAGSYSDARDRIGEGFYKAGEKALSEQKFDEAAACFEQAGPYSDAAERVFECYYKAGKAALSAKNYPEAAAAFEKAGDYSDAPQKMTEAAYAWGQQALSAGEQREALMAFDKADGYADAEVQAAELRRVLAPRCALTGGFDFSAGLRKNGTVVVAGEELFGNHNAENWYDIVSIDGGTFFTLGLKSDGRAVAAGDNEYGQCDVKDWTDIVSVSAGDNHAVGLRADGTVVATGNNDSGQCDTGDWTDIAAVAAGNNFTAGLRSDGTVVITGTEETRENVTQIWAGSYLAALYSDGTVEVLHGYGDASDWTDIVSISGGPYHVLGLRADGTVAAARNNENGQCNVEDWRDIEAIGASTQVSFGLQKDGTVIATGYTGDNYRGEDQVEHWENIGLPDLK